MSDQSFLAGYLKTNDPPAAEEVEVIQAYIKDQTEIAESIANKLSELDKARKLLQDQLDERTQSIEQHQATLSCIRRFPDDILISIFTALLAHDGFPSITGSHVCRGWRNLALATPSLWAKIAVTIEPERHPRPEAESVDMLPEEDLAVYTKEVEKWKQVLRGKYERVAEYIRRSGQCALSILIKTSESRESEFNDDIQKVYAQLIDVLVPTSSRWAYVDFDIRVASRDSVLVRLLQIPPGKVPNIKALRLKVGCQGDSAWMSKWVGMGMGGDTALQGEAPVVTTVGALRGASLTDLEVRCQSKQVIWLLPVPWKRLTRLSFQGGTHPPAFSQLDGLTILGNCPKLIECNMYFATQMDMMLLNFGNRKADQPLPNARVVLPDLKILRISGEKPMPQCLPARLVLPSLETLSIDFSRVARPCEVERSTHVEWIDEHGANLSTVTLDYISLMPAALDHCLQRLPNVVDLTLLGLNRPLSIGPLQPTRVDPSPKGAAVVNDQLLARLTPRFETETTFFQPCLCPKLRRLECRMGSLERNEPAMLKMVLARYGDGKKQMMGPVRRIEEVVLHYHRPQSVDIVKELERSGVDASHLALSASYVQAPCRAAEDLDFDVDF